MPVFYFFEQYVEKKRPMNILFDREGDPFAEEMVKGINSWAEVNHAKELSLEDVLAMKDKEGITEVEKNLDILLPADCLHTVVADGIINYIGDLKSEDGIVRIRIMCEMNMPHWPTPEMIRQMYAFFKHFSRDTRTGESIYSEFAEYAHHRSEHDGYPDGQRFGGDTIICGFPGKSVYHAFSGMLYGDL